jgi:hypothetical protein
MLIIAMMVNLILPTEKAVMNSRYLVLRPLTIQYLLNIKVL